MTTETTKGALIIRRALELMREGKARGWSHALEIARREVTAQSGA